MITALLAAAALVTGPAVGATISRAADEIAGSPVTITVWTVPPVVTGGYADPSTQTAYISPDYLAALTVLVERRPADDLETEWEGWAVMCLAHEVRHLRQPELLADPSLDSPAIEADAERFALAEAPRLLDLLGAHGTRKRRMMAAALRQFRTYMAGLPKDVR
jgi:hypothetical protein